MIWPRRAFCGTFTPLAKFELAQFSLCNGWSSPIFLSVKEYVKLGLPKPSEANLKYPSPTKKNCKKNQRPYPFYNVQEFDGSSELEERLMRPRHVALFGDRAFFGDDHRILESAAKSTGSTLNLWLTENELELCRGKLLQNGGAMLGNKGVRLRDGTSWFSIEDTSILDLLRAIPSVYRIDPLWYSVRRIQSGNCGSREKQFSHEVAVQLKIAALQSRQRVSEWWGDRQDFEGNCLQLRLGVEPLRVSDVNGPLLLYNAVWCSSFDHGVPPEHSMPLDTAKPLVVDISDRSMPRSTFLLSHVAQTEQYSSNKWISDKQIGERGLILRDDPQSGIIDFSSSSKLYNVDQLNPESIEKLNEIRKIHLPLSAFGTFILPTVVPIQKLRAAAEQFGFTSLYYVSQEDMVCFGVKPKPEAPAVLGHNGLSLWYNAQQTTDPSVFNRSNCRYFKPRNLEARRLPDRIVRQLRAFAIENGVWGEYWGTKAQWIQLFGARADFSNVTKTFVSVDGEELISNEQVANIGNVVERIVATMSSRGPLRIAACLEIEPLPVPSPFSASTFTSPFWVSAEVAAKYFSATILKNAVNGICHREEVLFNAQQTSRPDLFLPERITPCSALLGVFGVVLAAPFFQKALFEEGMNLSVKNGFLSPFWGTREHFGVLGLAVDPNKNAPALFFPTTKRLYYNAESTGSPQAVRDVALCSSKNSATAFERQFFGRQVCDELNSGRLVCPLCSLRTSVRHVVSLCQATLSRRRDRHNDVLRVLYNSLMRHPKGGQEVSDVKCDLPEVAQPENSKWRTGKYRPDLCFRLREVPFAIELTIPYGAIGLTSAAANFRKTHKYEAAQVKNSFDMGSSTPIHVIAVEVGCFGQLPFSTRRLEAFLTKEAAESARYKMSVVAAAATRRIFEKRNQFND